MTKSSALTTAGAVRHGMSRSALAPSFSALIPTNTSVVVLDPKSGASAKSRKEYKSE